MRVFKIIISWFLLISITTAQKSNQDSLISPNNLEYNESLHQLIVREAYKLIERHISGVYLEMKNHLGTNEHGSMPYWSPKIVSGAYNEDFQDVVFGYNSNVLWGGFDPYVTLSHFWDADNGDDDPTYIGGYYSNTTPPLGLNFGSRQNTFVKAKKFLYGNWDEKIYFYNSPQATYEMYYNNLFDAYSNHDIWVTAVLDITGRRWPVNPPQKITSYFTQSAADGFRDHIVWSVLGRACHLLADMAVPAHVNIDLHNPGWPHYDDDQWEHNIIGTTLHGRNNYTAWQQGGIFNDIVNQQDPLRYLFYTTNQITDYYPSFDDNWYGEGFGDRNYSSTHGTDFYTELDEFYNNSYGSQFVISTQNEFQSRTEEMKDVLLNMAIRANASLLYWFAEQVQLPITPINSFITIDPIIYDAGYRQGGGPIGGHFHIENNFSERITFKITASNPEWELLADIPFVPVQVLYIPVNPGWPRTVSYQGNLPLSAGNFTETITIESNTHPGVHKTHNIVGTISLPDACYETEKFASSPEEELFDESFQQPFFATNSLWTEEYEKLSLKEKMNFAYEMLDLPKTEKINVVCKKIIDLYASQVTDFTDFALNILWQASLDEEYSKEFDIRDFKDYLKELGDRKIKHRVYGWAELILSLFEEEGRLNRLEKICNEYPDKPLKELSLFHQFVYYYSKSDIRNIRATIEKMDKEFPVSKYTYQAHLIIKDKGYSSEGLKKLIESNNEKFLAKENLQAANLESIIPQEYQLFQNYPNPFNPNTTFKYSIPEDSYVDLSIYNSMGQLIKTVVSEPHTPGIYNIEWNSTNTNGDPVSSGLYFYSLKTESKIFMKKMILLK